MGVRGLFSYIQRHCPEALEDVNLHRLGDEYRRRYRTKPVLLLDGNNFLSDMSGDLEFDLGGQWVQYLEKLRTFLSAFHKAGFELKIFFDGVVEKKKVDTWIERRKKSRMKVAEIFENLKLHGTYPPDNRSNHTPSLSTFTRLALKSLGASVHNSSIELDRECYLYCKEHSCYGVASKDTDMMIYDIPALLLLKYDRGQITEVQQFRKDKLCRRLRLDPQFLPLFACLVGCDTTDKLLSGFHREGPWKDRIPRVARFIRSLQLRDLSRYSMDQVASQVSKSLGNGVLYECVQEYVCDSQEQAHGNQPSRNSETPSSSSSPASFTSHIDQEVLSKIKSHNFNLLITDTILQVITIHQYDSKVALEDDADSSMPSSALVYRPVRQRMYGLLSTQNLSPDNVTIEELCPYAGNPLDGPDVVQGQALGLVPQPTIEDLWMDSADESLRMAVFFSCFSSRPLLESGILDELPHHLVLLCCILHYLLLHALPSTLRPCDVDALIAQAICVQGHSPTSLEKIRVPTVKPRFAHLATIIMRGYRTGCDVNSACCLPFKMDDLLPWRSFDGKLFFLKYLAAEGGQAPAQLCDGRAKALETFSVMKRFIVMGTRLQM